MPELGLNDRLDSLLADGFAEGLGEDALHVLFLDVLRVTGADDAGRHFARPKARDLRSEEHTSELQSPDHLVCRLLLEKKKRKYFRPHGCAAKNPCNTCCTRANTRGSRNATGP